MVYIKNKNNFYLLVLLLFAAFNVFAEQPAASVVAALEDGSNKAIAIKQKIQASSVEPAAMAKKMSAAENQMLAVLEPAVFVHKVKGKMNKIYKRLFTGLENNGYYVIFEPNLGRNLAHFAKRWGKDYNKNKLDSIRSMVFCNGWYANKISNEDPNMLALCPLHVTLVHKAGYTRVLFIKPGIVSQGSAANSIALELEQDVIRIIKESAR